MNKLLLVSGLLLTSVVTLSAQVGSDPQLVDPNGSPVMVPPKSHGNDDNSSQFRSPDRPKYHIPGTLRGAERNELGEHRPPEGDFEYVPVAPASDSTSVYVFDDDGNRVHDINTVYPDPQQPASGTGIIDLFDAE